MLEINDLVMVRIPQYNTEEYLKYCKYDSRLALERLGVIDKAPKANDSECVVKLFRNRDKKLLKIPIVYIHKMKSEEEKKNE